MNIENVIHNENLTLKPLPPHTHTSFIIMSNKGRLPALGLGAERPEQQSSYKQ